MRLLCAGLAAALAIWLAAGNQARAQQIYKWTDKQGVTHFTDNIDELPEPMRSRALEKYKPKRRAKQPHGYRPVPRRVRPPPGPGRDPVRMPHDRIPPGPADHGGPLEVEPAGGSQIEESPGVGKAKNSKSAWQDRMSAARKRVADLEAQCKNLQGESDRASRDGLTLGRPMDRARAAKSRTELENCRKKLKQARHRLEVELPEQARRRGVPPGWLR